MTNCGIEECLTSFLNDNDWFIKRGFGELGKNTLETPIRDRKFSGSIIKKRNFSGFRFFLSYSIIEGQ